MKSGRQYKDSLTFVGIGFVGTLGVMILLVVSTLIPGCSEWHERMGEVISNDPRYLSPIANYQQTTFYDTTGMQKEQGSIDDYMRHWYEVLDTNSDGDIDYIDTNCGTNEWYENSKEPIDWTGTTQGERTYEEQLSIEPDYIYYDTTQTNE